MLKALIDALLPLPAIARELKRLADLYELSLAERMIGSNWTAAPVIVRPERPRRDDTEVFYTDVEPAKRGRNLPDDVDAHDMGWENEG